MLASHSVSPLLRSRPRCALTCCSSGVGEGYGWHGRSEVSWCGVGKLVVSPPRGHFWVKVKNKSSSSSFCESWEGRFFEVECFWSGGGEPVAESGRRVRGWLDFRTIEKVVQILLLQREN